MQQKYEGRAKLIASGTDLLGDLKDKILPEYPEALINIKTISGLDYIKEDVQVLKIGSRAQEDLCFPYSVPQLEHWTENKKEEMRCR